MYFRVYLVVTTFLSTIVIIIRTVKLIFTQLSITTTVPDYSGSGLLDINMDHNFPKTYFDQVFEVGTNTVMFFILYYLLYVDKHYIIMIN